MRLPRFFGKKLGHRRTGSQAWGSFGEALFYAALVAAGACFVGLLFSGMGGVESDAAGMPWARWWLWLFALLMPGALLAFGASGLVRTVRSWGKSEERRAATGAMTDFLDPIARGQGLLAKRAGVPAWEDLVNSPGTVLRYRLPIENPENWTLLGIGLFVILWNAVLVILAVNASLDLLHGRVESVLLAVLIPFGVVGVTAILLFARRLVLATAVGTTQLEISDHPLVPGGRYDVLIAQGGVGLFTTLTVTLEAEEMASFRQGTDTRTERIVVVRDAVGEWTEVRINPGVRFEAHLPIVIPNDAMHSFASEHNAVRWRLVVQGQPQRWAAFVRSFPIVVFPQAAAAMADEYPGPAVLEGSG